MTQDPPRHRDLSDVEIPVRKRNQHTHPGIDRSPPTARPATVNPLGPAPPQRQMQALRAVLCHPPRRASPHARRDLRPFPRRRPALPERGSAQRRTASPARSLGGKPARSQPARCRRGCYRPARGSLDGALADSTKRACMSTHLPSSGTAPPVDGPSHVPACEFRRADATKTSAIRTPRYGRPHCGRTWPPDRPIRRLFARLPTDCRSHSAIDSGWDTDTSRPQRVTARAVAERIRRVARSSRAAAR
jgi:hypothetical protein